MGLTKLTIRRPVSAVILIAAIVVFGIMSVVTMPQELTPEMEMPYLFVITVYPGAAPEDVDKLVSKEIEGAAGSLSGVKSVQSESSESMSLVFMEYEYGTNMDIAYTDLRERVNQIESSLPDDINTPIIMEINMNAMAVMSLSISSETMDNLLATVEDDIVPEFEKLASVADITVSGGDEQYIKVELMQDRMQQHGVTMSSVAAAVSSADFSMPIGSADYGSQSLSMRTEVKYDSLEALRNIPVTVPTGGVIRLSDVADIYMSTKDASSLSRYNGNDNIGLSIQKRQSASAVTVSRAVTGVVEQLREEYPDMNIDIVSDNSESISSSINSVAQTLVLGIVLSMIVLFIFFGDLRASFIVGSSMPVSLLITFIIMNLMGFSLNVITLSGMVLGVGMMVDNAIVVIDSCFKSQKEGRTFMEAALEGTKFVMLSIAASTVTTVVVFLPLALIQGMSGQLFKPLGFTIVFALLASLVSAITLVPLFYVQFKPRERENALMGRVLRRIQNSYAMLLRKLLNHKVLVVLVSVALLAVSVLAATNINMELMPNTDQGTISVTVTARPGLKLEKVDTIMVRIEDMVAAHPDVEHYTMAASTNQSMMGTGNTVTAYLRDNRAMKTVDVVEQWRLATQDILDCDVDVASSSMMSMTTNTDTVSILLKGTDLDRLEEGAKMVEDVMKQHPDVLRTSSNMENTMPQAKIVVDPMKASAVGMSPSMVAGLVYNAVNGTDTVDVRIDDKNYTITVEYPDGMYNTVADVENMILSTGYGDVALSEVASVEFTSGPRSIMRMDNQYYAQLSATPTQAAYYTASAEITQAVAALDLPHGIQQDLTSDMQSMNEEFASLGMAIVVAILLVFMVMAIQFESIKHSVMVMVCLPFSMIGAFGLLWLVGSTISMVSLLGFLILVGTVVNNGILFVDTTNQYRQTMPLKTALVETGRTRLRPILMTTLTTVLSMLPLALGIGEGAQMMQGMGVTVIGGLTASTVLTLLLLPTFYLLIDGNPKKKERRGERRAGRRDARHERISEKLSRQEQKVKEIQQRKLEKKQSKVSYEKEEDEDLLHK